LEKRDWQVSQMEDETQARKRDREENKEHFTKIIELCNARFRNAKAIKGASLATTSG
jgi:hypothetical protein